MCFQDLAISRNAIVRTSILTMTGLPVRIPANPDRIRLTLQPANQKDLYVFLSEGDFNRSYHYHLMNIAATTTGFLTGTLDTYSVSELTVENAASYSMDCHKDPGLVSGELWIYSQFSATIQLVETILPAAFSAAIQGMI